MNYLLTPSQKAFKKAVRAFLESEESSRLRDGSEAPEKFETGLMARFRGAFPEAAAKGLGIVESIIALEEIARVVPAAASRLPSDAAFPDLPPVFGRAAANLGSAEGLLAPRLSKTLVPPAPGGDRDPDVRAQVVGDLASAIESCRLLLFRAAVLGDSGMIDFRGAASVEGFSRDIKSRAVAVLDEISKGE
jgi:hypothetical protein